MEVACAVERVTMRAQTALNETIDRVITVLDHQYDDNRPSSTHWCTRWGLLPTEPEESSSVISSSSLGQLTQATPTLSANFLGFAAFHGLFLYVHDILTARVERDDPNTMTLLLRLICSPFPEPRYFNTWSLQLVSLLLNRGANPNIISCCDRECRSAWTRSLQQLSLDYQQHPQGSLDYWGYVRPSEKQLTTLARTFLEAGADVDAILGSTFHDPFSWIISGDMDTKLERFRGGVLMARTSLLAYLQDATDNLPHVLEIRKMCVDQGASWTSRSIVLWIDRYSSWTKTILLSKQQSDDVDKIMFATHCKRAGIPVSPEIEELRAMLVKLYDELGLAKTEGVDTDSPLLGGWRQGWQWCTN